MTTALCRDHKESTRRQCASPAERHQGIGHSSATSQVKVEILHLHNFPRSWQSLLSLLSQVVSRAGKKKRFCFSSIKSCRRRSTGGGPVPACSPPDSIPSLRKPIRLGGTGAGMYFKPSTSFPLFTTCRKNDHFVCYTLGNQFQSPGDFLGLLSTFILLFLIYSFDLHNLNILSSF